MINYLVGPSGGGKSYEATVFHVLPALKKGRKIITNLPLNIEAFEQLDPSYPDLLDVRREAVLMDVEIKRYNVFKGEDSIRTEQRLIKPFATMKDYGDPWRHPEQGFGPLYIIDECHEVLPRKGIDEDVNLWFSMHRHEFADVLLMTQNTGKVNADINGNIQVVYRVRKGVAFGTSKQYVRKVQDGLKGDVVNTAVREYKKQYFGLYNSHTKSEAGQELTGNDIVPLWKRWPFIGAAAFLLLFVGLMIFSPVKFNIIGSANAKNQSAKIENISPLPGVVSPAVPAVSSGVSVASAVAVAPVHHHPFDRLEFHVIAYLEAGSHSMYSFRLTQNGQPAFTASQNQLIKAGYVVIPVNECAARITYGADVNFFATCDLPRETIGQNPTQQADYSKPLQVSSDDSPQPVVIPFNP